jgi:hypothetical protein
MRELPLTQGEFAIVDDEDFHRLSFPKWQLWKNKRGNKYAFRKLWNKTSKRYESQWLHREILGLTSSDYQVDHKDNNGLNNVRSNLRIATNAQNCANKNKAQNKSSSFKGVSFKKRINKFESYIRVDGRYISLGYFSNETEAAKSYNAAALKHFGQFAKLNIL